MRRMRFLDIPLEKITPGSETNQTPGYIAMTPAGQSEQRFTMAADKVYVNATETAIFECDPSASVTPVIGYYGIWMHGYFYIDLDNNGKLAYDVTKVEQTECVSFTFWSGDFYQEDTGMNSLGQRVGGSNRNSVNNNMITLPAFIAPAEDGTYNVRFKVDWNSVEPQGSTHQSIVANGGYIVDAVLKVGSGVATGISTLSDVVSHHSTYDLSGRRVRQVARGIYIQNGKKVLR